MSVKSMITLMVFQILVGIWLIISPFVLGYRQIATMTANDVVFGGVVIILGIITAFAVSPVLRHAEKKAD
jgi:uncharacterized membrane protein